MKNLHAGISLIGILVGLAVSSLVAVGLIEIFKSSKTSYGTVTNLAELNANGRFALYKMGEIIQLAGFGLHSTPPAATYTDPLNHTKPYTYGYSAYVSGWRPVGCYLLPSRVGYTNGSINFTACRDLAETRSFNYFAFGSTSTATSQCLMQDVSDTAYLGINEFSQVDARLCDLSCSFDTDLNCGGTYNAGIIGHVYEKIEPHIRNIGLSSINSSHEFEISFRGNGQLQNCQGTVVPINSVSLNTFSVQAVDNGSGTVVNSLVCRTNTDSTWTVLAPNVETMKVEYGQNITKSGTVLYYSAGESAASASIIDILDIMSIRVALLLRSELGATTTSSTKTFSLFGTDYTTSNDDRLYRVFEKTFFLSYATQLPRFCPQRDLPSGSQFDARNLVTNLVADYTSSDNHTRRRNCVSLGACHHESYPNECIIPINRGS